MFYGNVCFVGASMINGYDAEKIISRYIELRDHIKNEDKTHSEKMKPYKEAMEILEAAAAAMMKETGQSALRADSGTAFPVNKVSIKCLNKDEFHKFVRESQGWHFLTGNVVREAVENYMEAMAGQVPPGLEVTGYTEIQFRKA